MSPRRFELRTPAFLRLLEKGGNYIPNGTYSYKSGALPG